MTTVLTFLEDTPYLADSDIPTALLNAKPESIVEYELRLEDTERSYKVYEFTVDGNVFITVGNYNDSEEWMYCANIEDFVHLYMEDDDDYDYSYIEEVDNS